MQNLIRISDAAVIALHTADYLARQETPLSSAGEIARALKVSYNHLSKVLQQLTKAGLLLPARGPKGGFALSPAGRKGRVREFISAIDGPPPASECLLKHRVCGSRACVFGKFLGETNRNFKKVLDRRISDFGKNQHSGE